MLTCHDSLPPVDLTRISAVSILSGEHQVILQTLAVLERLGQLADRGDLRTADATDVLTILRTFADRCHHGKEEDLLFPALEALAPGFGPTQVMRGEHVEGRALIAAMVGAVDLGRSGVFAASAMAYVNLLRQHIDKEDHILFPMAQAMLSLKADADLLAAYARLEHEDLGDGTHVRLLAMADRLADAHGVPRASAMPSTRRLLTAVCGCRSGAGVLAGCGDWRVDLATARELSVKITRVHGHQHPEVVTLEQVLATLAATGDEDQAGQAALVRRVRALTDDLQPWPGACASVHRCHELLRGVLAALPQVA